MPRSAGEILADESLPQLVRLRKVFSWFLEYFADHGFQRGCPVGNIAQEMSDLNPAFRDKLDQAVGQMVNLTAKTLSKAQKAGELDMKHDPQELARFIISSWEGSLILMKVERRAEPMLTFDRMVFENLLA
jgi:TetR/AcrR family transcriptional repressor of nem operon